MKKNFFLRVLELNIKYKYPFASKIFHNFFINMIKQTKEKYCVKSSLKNFVTFFTIYTQKLC